MCHFQSSCILHTGSLDRAVIIDRHLFLLWQLKTSAGWSCMHSFYTSSTCYVREICRVGEANHVAEQWGSVSEQEIQAEEAQKTCRGREREREIWGSADGRAEGGAGRGEWTYPVTWQMRLMSKHVRVQSTECVRQQDVKRAQYRD